MLKTWKLLVQSYYEEPPIFPHGKTSVVLPTVRHEVGCTMWVGMTCIKNNILTLLHYFDNSNLIFCINPCIHFLYHVSLLDIFFFQILQDE